MIIKDDDITEVMMTVPMRFSCQKSGKIERLNQSFDSQKKAGGYYTANSR